MTEWSEIVKQHGEVVWKTVYRLLGNDSDSSDCFQETFVAALEVARRLDVRNWPALLKRIATVRALDRLRQRARESDRWIQQTDAAAVASRHSPPEHEAELAETIELLTRTVAKLPPQQSQVVCLYYIEGYTYGQISKQLEISVNHVGVLLYRAKAALRDMLAEHPCFPFIDSTRHAKNG